MIRLVSQIVQQFAVEKKIIPPNLDLQKEPFSPVVCVGESILESINGSSKLLLQHCNCPRQVGRQVALQKYNLNSRTVACAPAIIAGHDTGRNEMEA